MKYDLNIEVLTPLSIGAGAEKDWVRGVDFVVNKVKIYKLNLKKIVKEGVKMDKLTSFFASKNEQGIISLITEPKLAKVSDFVMPLSADSPNDIKAFVKNQLTGKPILAGSSLKGAIRSILFDYLRDREHDEKQVFGSSVKGDEFMRFIKISDAEFDGTSLVNTKIFNLQKNNGSWCGGWKHGGKETGDNYKSTGFNTIYECLKPSQSGFASIMLSNQFLEIDWDKFYKQLEDNARKESEKDTIKHLKSKLESKKSLLKEDKSIGSLFGVINAHTKEYLAKEKAFFEKYQTDKTNLIVESINNLLNIIPSDNSYCILKMSAGSGFHSITGDWQFDDYSKTGLWDKSGKQKYKSRKIAVWDNHFDLMGFIRISALSEEEVLSLQEKKRQELADREALRREQEEEQQWLLNEYEKNYTLAKQAYENKNWEDVLEFAQKASETLPNKSDDLKQFTEEALQNIKLLKNQQAIEKAKEEEEEERRLKNLVPLSEKIANVSKLPTLFNNLKTWMKYNDCNSLSNEELAILRNKITDIFSNLKAKEQKEWKQKEQKWKDLSALIGEDVVKNWIDSL